MYKGKDLKFSESSNLFALERNNGLSAILGSVYQTFNGVDVYNSIEKISIANNKNNVLPLSIVIK